MKYGIVSALAFVLLCPPGAGAQKLSSQPGRNALGIRISSQDPALSHSLTYKYFFNNTVAVEALFSLPEPVAIGALVEKHTAFGPAGVRWFWGAGAYAGFGSIRRFGTMGALGLDFLSPRIPLNLSLDWKPELNISREFSFEPAAIGLSARFVF